MRWSACWTRTLVTSLLFVPAYMAAQDTAQGKPSLTVYGFAMADLIADAGAMDPNWFDMIRPTKLPAFKDEFGKNGNFWASVRQTRFGVRGSTPTPLGLLSARFEIDLTGTGVVAGQTQLRLRYAYGELGDFAFGQMNSPFMDLDIFPNTLEAWGPPGMAFFRNVQVRWQPLRGESQFVIALERPGASGDQGAYSGRVELAGVTPRFPAPDLSAEYRFGRKWGYVEVAGIVRYIVWDDLTASDTLNVGGHTVGAGVHVSSRINVGSAGDQIKLLALYGKGVQNYLNDAPIDIGVKTNFTNPTRPFLGTALPVFSAVAFYDHVWNKQFTSSIGYSQVNTENSDGQLPSDFRLGQYALANVIYTPVKDVLFGVEAQWGQRQNKSNGYTANDYRLQFSGKYTFGMTFGGGSSQ